MDAFHRNKIRSLNVKQAVIQPRDKDCIEMYIIIFLDMDISEIAAANSMNLDIENHKLELFCHFLNNLRTRKSLTKILSKLDFD